MTSSRSSKNNTDNDDARGAERGKGRDVEIAKGKSLLLTAYEKKAIYFVEGSRKRGKSTPRWVKEKGERKEKM